jgi:uncharacterized protein (DUF2336 family)
MAIGKLHALIELAREPSSERRRELLREVTDLFLAQPADGLDPAQAALFDEVMQRIASEMEEAVRAELAQRLAPTHAALPKLLNDLGGDAIAVAEPVLRRASGLREEDLLTLARTRGQAHLKAISQRERVPEAVSDAIVERGDDSTLGVLLRNEGAALSRQASETAVDRAQANPELHSAVVERRSLPPDLMNEMYFIVEARLRAKIMARNAELDPRALEAALQAGRKRLEARDGVAPPDLSEAEAHVDALVRKGELEPKTLVRFLREGERTRFTAALARMADIDFQTAQRILGGRRVDPLAIVCKASGFDRALFLTFVVLMLDSDENALGRAQEYGDLYNQLSTEAASRAIRFWRLRRQTADVAA